MLLIYFLVACLLKELRFRVNLVSVCLVLSLVSLTPSRRAHFRFRQSNVGYNIARPVAALVTVVVVVVVD